MGRVALERLVAEQDVLLVRGKKIPNFGMIKVERIKVLNRQETLSESTSGTTLMGQAA
jgi:hypothetical protein